MVPVQTSLSLTSCWLTRIIAVAYLLLGLIMFVVPGWSAHHFPWSVRGAIGLVIIIVIAALLNIGIFHFSAYPRHIVYLASYVAVMIGTVGILVGPPRNGPGGQAGLPPAAPSWPAPAAPAPRR